MFITDSQTQNDLQIFSSGKSQPSIISIFEQEISSHNGKTMLNLMFSHPLQSKEEINDRSGYIRYFGTDVAQKIKVDNEALDFIEYYLSLDIIPSRFSFIDGLRKHVRQLFKANNEYYVIKRGIRWLIDTIDHLYGFANACRTSGSSFVGKLADTIVDTIERHALDRLTQQKDKRLSFYTVEKFDYILRYLKKENVRKLLDIIYQIDVYQAAATVMQKHKLVFAEQTENVMLNVNQLFHPLLSNPVANSITLGKDSNIVFITGANMAGKSTFMKALGITVYLAHMGFPVPAKSMQFSTCNGLFSSINVPDSLSLGYSHFYSEVQRIKLVAQQMDESKSFVIIFDELFRGTNVKDAHEATVEIIKLFSGIKNSFFIFSSHILEAAEELRSELPDIQFKCFQTKLENNTLSYSYEMKDGISNDRFGMYIIKKEEISEIIQLKKSLHIQAKSHET